MADRKVINLDAIRGVAAVFSVGGVEHNVFHISGGDVQILQTAEPKELAVKFFEIASRCVPTLDVWKLDSNQAQAIVTAAMNGVEAVEALFPNVVSLETDPTSPG